MTQPHEDLGETPVSSEIAEDSEDDLRESSIIIDPAALKDLEQLVPGAAKAFFDNALAEAAHARQLELEQAAHERALAAAHAAHEQKLQEKALESHDLDNYRADDREKERNRLRSRGQLVAGFIATLALLVTALALFEGAATAPVSLIILATAILAGVVRGSKQENKELRARLEALSQTMRHLPQAYSRALKDGDASNTRRLRAGSASSSTASEQGDDEKEPFV